MVTVETQPEKRTFASRARYYLPSLRDGLHLRLRLANAISGLLPDYVSGVVRGRLYRRAGFRIGYGTFLMGNIEIISPQSGFYGKLEIGERVTIGTHVTINVDERVIIEDNVTIGPFVRIYTGTHDIGPGSQRCAPGLVAKPVIIERGSWVAMGAMILPGVRIGHGSVVAAGAVVTKDVPPNSYVSGVPATVQANLPRGNK